MSDPLKTARKKLTIIRRYQRRCQEALDRLDWEEQVLLPELEELERKAQAGMLPQFTIESE